MISNAEGKKFRILVNGPLPPPYGGMETYCQDFFGNERNVKAIDMGCFAFDKALLDQGYRKEWYLEWPYHYRDKNAASRIPDLWKPPETKALQNP